MEFIKICYKTRVELASHLKHALIVNKKLPVTNATLSDFLGFNHMSMISFIIGSNHRNQQRVVLTLQQDHIQHPITIHLMQSINDYINRQ